MHEWLPQSKYEHVPITAAAGSHIGGTAWKFVGHSTEGPPGSIDGTIALFRAQPASTPHLMIDPMGTQRRVQMIPLNRSACALRGGQSGWQTNRARALQLEIVGYTDQSRNWPDPALWQIADVIADLILAGYPINIDNAPDTSVLSGTLARSSSPQRMSPEAFHRFDGIGWHVFVPFNDHYDVAYLNSRRITEFARDILHGQGMTIVPRPLPPLPPPPTAPQVGLISKGMTGGAVTMIQDLLIGLDYNCGPTGGDGVFGFATEQCVRQFQADAGLAVDGIVGPATNAAISARYAVFLPTPPLPAPPDPAVGVPAWPGRFLRVSTPMMSGNDVRTWQGRMAERGWRIAVDGWFGEASETTCLTFQREKGLSVDGIVGRQTWDAAWTSPVT